VLLLLGQPLLLPGHLQLPGVHLLEVLIVVLAVPLKLGLLEGKLAGRCLGALLQLGMLVAEALVFGLKRLPLPQDRCLSLLEGLMGARQHLGGGALALLLARRRTGATAQKSPPSPPEGATGWS
jgi:hypothetical protein